VALINCSECRAEISDRAVSCPKCGNPMGLATVAAATGQVSSPRAPAYSMPDEAPKKSGGWLKWIFIVPAALFGMVMCIGAVADRDGSKSAARFEKQKAECTTAMMSSIGHSTTGYADKAAYDAKVREACNGLTLNGKELGK